MTTILLYLKQTYNQLLLNSNNRRYYLILLLFSFFQISNAQLDVELNFGSWGKTKDGRFAICHNVTLENTDEVNSVCSPQAVLDLSDYPSVSGIIFTQYTGSGFDLSDLDTSASGVSSTNVIGNLIDPSTSKCIAPGDKIYIKFLTYANPANWPDGVRYNAEVNFTGTNTANGNQSASHTRRSNVMYDSDVIIGGALEVYQNNTPLGYGAQMQPNIDGSYDLTYRVTLGNYDNDFGTGGTATNLTYADRLEVLYDNMPINSIAIISSGSGNLTLNPNYNGGAPQIGGINVTPDNDLVTNGTLNPEQEDYVDVTLNVGPIDFPQKLMTRWTTGNIHATDALNNRLFVQTTEGTDPTGGNSIGPAVTCDNGLAITFDYNADITVNKTLTNASLAASGTNGNYDLTYEVSIASNNSNNVNIYRLSAIDPVATSFGSRFVGVTTQPFVSNSSASSTPLANSSFDGSSGSGSGSGVDLLAGNATNLLEPSQSFTITYTVEVNQVTQPLNNSVEVIAHNSLDQLIDSGNDSVVYQNTSIDNCDPIASGYPDTDGDGISDVCDLDDDNDGILDTDECTIIDSGLTGPLPFTANISSTNPSSQFVPHTLNSLVFNGEVFNDFVVPDGFNNNIAVNNPDNVEYIENGVIQFTLGNNPNFETDILTGFQSRNLNSYISLEPTENYNNGDYYDLTYNTIIRSTADGFIALTERGGNNSQTIQALDFNGDLIGTPILVEPSDYTNLGHQVNPLGNQNVYMALYPIDDLVTPGVEIYGIRVTFPGANLDGPDTKVFFFGDLSSIQCDIDMDSIPNPLDLDSDNDGCVDTIEAGHTDPDNDGYLGNSPVTVDANGLVTGQGGYTGATGNELLATQVTVNTAPTNQNINNGSSATFTIDASSVNTTTFSAGTPDYASGIDSSGQLQYQWQEDGSDLSNSGVYSGVTTNTLTIADATGLGGRTYTVLVTHSNNNCIAESRSADLIVTPNITINDSSTVEGTNNVFTITASNAIDQDVVFNIDYTDISTNNADYTGPTTITLLANTTSISFDVAAVEDTLIEPTETFEVVISYDSGANVNITDGQGTGTITDNDGGAGTGISFNNDNITVDEAAGTATI